MPKLKLPDGSKKEYETLEDLVEAHPEIKGCAMIYRWEEYTAEIEEEDGTTFIYSYDKIDWEYSYVGGTGNLREFSQNYGVWDESELTLDREGILTGNKESYDYSNPHKEYEIPDEDEADNLKLIGIKLASGNTVWIP